MDRGVLAQLPEWFWGVPYDGARIPGSSDDDRDLVRGANCQMWAFGVLAWFGQVIPPFRSDELWFDESVTRRVEVPEPLDLLLHNSNDEPFGAHVGLWTGSGVAHLAREIGRPVVWSEDELMSRERYATRVGIKRLLPTESG